MRLLDKLFSNLVVSILTILSVWVSADMAFRISALMHGEVYSPFTGIPSTPIDAYRTKFWAASFFLFFFPTLSCVFVFSIKWFLSKSSSLIFQVGLITGCICLVPYFFLVVYSAKSVYP